MAQQLGYLSLALYLASFLCYARILYAPNIWIGRLATLLLASGIVAQYFSLYQRSRVIQSVPYDDLYGSMSLFAWLLGITYIGLEIFHRQRSVGAFVTLLLVAWVAGLGFITAAAPPARVPARGPLFAFHVTLEHLGLCGLRAVLRAELDLFGAGPGIALAASGRCVLAFSSARRARPHGPQQRVCRPGGARVRREYGIRLGTPAQRHLFVRRSKGNRHVRDRRSLCRVSAALA